VFAPRMQLDILASVTNTKCNESKVMMSQAEH